MSDVKININEFSTIDAENYVKQIVSFPKDKVLSLKARRNFRKRLLDNPNVRSIIEAAVDAIVKRDDSAHEMVSVHLDLLSRRRNPKAALKLCQYVTAYDDFEAALIDQAKILECQTLVQTGKQEVAISILSTHTWLQTETNKAVEGLMAWYHIRNGDLKASTSHFIKSNAKHIQCLSAIMAPSKLLLDRTIRPESIKVFTTTYNEMEFIGAFLDYYRKLGDITFIIIDNQSTDGTPEFLSEQLDVVLWSNSGSFNESHFGSVWINEIVSKVTRSDELCIRVDADEILSYDSMQDEPIEVLLSRLNDQNIDIVPANLLDMYPKDLSFPNVTTGADIIAACTLYDDTVRLECDYYPPYMIHRGGVRERLFGVRTNLTKTPIFRGGGAIKYLNANHTTTPGIIADETLRLLHYKFTPNAIHRFQEQLERGEHYNGGHRYRKFIQLINSGVTDIRDACTKELTEAVELLSNG